MYVDLSKTMTTTIQHGCEAMSERVQPLYKIVLCILLLIDVLSVGRDVEEVQRPGGPMPNRQSVDGSQHFCSLRPWRRNFK